MALLMMFLVMFAVLPASWCYAGSCKAPKHSGGCYAHPYPYKEQSQVGLLPNPKSALPPRLVDRVEDGDYCSLACSPGYHTPVRGFSRCHNGHFLDELKCVKNGASCETPSGEGALGCEYRPHARRVQDTETCYVDCKSGYYAAHSVATCHNGHFSPTLRCVKNGASCAVPSDEGTLGCDLDLKGSVEDNDFCLLKCKPGYHPLNRYPICDDGQFHPELKCVETGASCAVPLSEGLSGIDPLRSEGLHGDGIDPSRTTVEDGGSIRVLCKSGYHAPNGRDAACHDGQFYPTLSCVKNGASCAAPSDQGTLGCNDDLSSSVEDTEFCSLKCKPGYHAPNPHATCHDGQFNSMLRCVENGGESTMKQEFPNTWLVVSIAAIVLITLLIAFYTAHRYYCVTSSNVDQSNLLSA